jgi:hypothetical protein
MSSLDFLSPRFQFLLLFNIKFLVQIEFFIFVVLISTSKSSLHLLYFRFLLIDVRLHLLEYFHSFYRPVSLHSCDRICPLLRQ